MILVDTSVWVDHLRLGDAQLSGMLESGRVVMHPFVVGEIACGSMTQRAAVLALLQDLPHAVVATHEELLAFIERHALHGKRVGYVDVHLLAAVALTGGVSLWTRDKALRAAAQALGFAYLGNEGH